MTRLRELSRREREMMDIVYSAGRATANDVRARMAAPPSYSAVRATLRILERKGLLAHVDDGGRYLYRPTLPREKAREGAIEHLLSTFFEGSAAGAVMTLLQRPELQLTPAELARMSALVAKARKEGR